MIREIVFAGGDTDSIASMAGQCLGAWLGAALPAQWLDALACRAEIELAAEELAGALELE